MISNLDIFSEEPASRLHFGKKYEFQSRLGGVCTIILGLIFAGIIVYQAIPVFQKINPTNRREMVMAQDQQIFYHEENTYKIIFFMRDYAKHFDHDPTKSDIYVNHYHYEFDEEAQKFKDVNITRYEVNKCNESDFMTEVGKAYWHTEQTHFPHCIQSNKTLSLVGLSRNRYLHKTYSFFKIIVDKCNGRNCSTDDEIESYLYEKHLEIQILNFQLDLDTSHGNPVIEYPISVQTMNLNTRSIVKGNFKFRKNILNLKESIFGIGTEIVEFVDFEEQDLNKFSKKQQDFSDPKYKPYKNRIIELNFFISSTLIKTAHVQKTLLDVLISLAGVPNGLYLLLGYLLRKYQNFNSNILMYNGFHTKLCHEEEDHIIQIGIWERVKIYLSQMYFLKKCCCCFINKRYRSRPTNQERQRKFLNRNLI